MVDIRSMLKKRSDWNLSIIIFFCIQSLSLFLQLGLEIFCGLLNLIAFNSVLAFETCYRYLHSIYSRNKMFEKTLDDTVKTVVSVRWGQTENTPSHTCTYTSIHTAVEITLDRLLFISTEKEEEDEKGMSD